MLAVALRRDVDAGVAVGVGSSFAHLYTIDVEDHLAASRILAWVNLGRERFGLTVVERCCSALTSRRGNCGL